MSHSQTSPATPVPENLVARNRLAQVFVYTGRDAKVAVEQVIYPVSVDSPDALMAEIAEVLSTISRGFARKWVPVRLYDGRADPACYWMLANHESRMIDDPAHREPDGERRAWQDFLAELPGKRAELLEQEAADEEPAEPTDELQDVWQEPAAPEASPVVGFQDAAQPPARAHQEMVEAVRPAMVERRTTESWTAPAPEPYNPGEHFQMESLMSKGKHTELATMGLRGMANRTGLVNLKPSAAENGWRKAQWEMGQPWEGLRAVAVINEKGGAGKSPIAAMLAAAYARETPFAVHLFDNNESAGTILTRLSLTGAHTWTAKDLAAAFKARGGLTRSQMESFLHFHQEDRYALLAAHRPRFRGDTLTPEEVHNVYLAQEEHVSLSITDSGNTLTSPNWEQMVLECDQLVVPVMTAPDRDQGALTTLATLEAWGEQDESFKEKAMASVVLISQWRPKDDVKAPVARWSEKVPEGNVIVIPYDPHLGSHDLRFSTLKPRTQLAFMRAAAAVRRGWGG